MTAEELGSVVDERTIIGSYDSRGVDTSMASTDDAYNAFIEAHKAHLEEYCVLKNRRSTKEFVIEHDSWILTETSTGYLLLKILDLQMKGKSRTAKKVAKQYLYLQYILDLAKSTSQDPRACVRCVCCSVPWRSVV